MSSLIDFIKSLIGRTEKSTLQKDIENVIKELEGYTLPQVSAAAEYSRVNPFECPFYEVFSSHLHGMLRIRGSVNPFLALGEALDVCIINARFLKDVIDAEFQTDTLRDGMSARAGILIRSTESLAFISEYSMKVTDYLLQREIEYVTKEADEDLAPATVAYIEDNMDRFMHLLFDMSVDPKDFKTMIDNVPAVVVNTSNISKVEALYSKSSLDPFKNGQAMNGFVGNPIYHVRMMIVAYEAKRLQNAKDRKKSLELRMIHLKNVKNDNPNPAVEREIEGLQKRIDEYDRFIREQMDSVR